MGLKVINKCHDDFFNSAIKSDQNGIERRGEYTIFVSFFCYVEIKSDQNGIESNIVLYVFVWVTYLIKSDQNGIERGKSG